MKTNLFAYLALALLFVGSAAALDATTPGIHLTLLNQNPDPARAGDVITERLLLANGLDVPASGVKVKVEENYPFTSTDDSPAIDVGTLNSFQVSNNNMGLTYHIRIDKDATAGTYDLKFLFTTDAGSTAEYTFPVTVTSQNFAQTITVDTSKLEPGKETPVTFRITNAGQSALQNLVFSWAEPNGVILPVYSDNTKYIPYLDVGKSIDLQYTLVTGVNTVPGLYSLNLNLQYQTPDNATSRTISTKAGMAIGGTTDFDVAFSESTNGQTSLSVANIGNNPALSVSVQIPNQPGYRVSGSSNAIIGNLDRGDYTIVSFQIASATPSNGTGTGTGASGRNFTRTGSGGGFAGRNGTFANLSGINPNDLQVIVDYTDTAGFRQSVGKSVPIQFRSAGVAGATGMGSASSTTTTFPTTTEIVIGVVVLAAAGIWYWRARANKAKGAGKNQR